MSVSKKACRQSCYCLASRIDTVLKSVEIIIRRNFSLRKRRHSHRPTPGSVRRETAWHARLSHVITLLSYQIGATSREWRNRNIAVAITFMPSYKNERSDLTRRYTSAINLPSHGVYPLASPLEVGAIIREIFCSFMSRRFVEVMIKPHSFWGQSNRLQKIP